jgi:hypothetical protein
MEDLVMSSTKYKRQRPDVDKRNAYYKFFETMYKVAIIGRLELTINVWKAANNWRMHDYDA